ncbi:hypothetical protein PUN28_001669 [Cardiocondyla obscurior]|uniref:Uncharacterized protein n=1 Tax=Cardiocondyla obscurior TaxID=286306 RepID=A0AAW2GQL2_9HYME
MRRGRGRERRNSYTERTSTELEPFRSGTIRRGIPAHIELGIPRTCPAMCSQSISTYLPAHPEYLHESTGVKRAERRENERRENRERERERARESRVE